ncbi:MAG: diaminopimelate epimerase [Epsilonproteobacteria bacterium]|nr:diaminopimelate epimerase [Campylobacterota bacterium]
MQISKYDASGNDFIIFHSFIKRDRSRLAKKLCDRKRGIGADGMIVLVPHSEYDYEWEFYNSDGSVAEMCGNGSRAAAHYAVSNSLAPSSHSFLTLAGVIEAEVRGDFVKIKLTSPEILKEPFEEEGFLWHFYDTGVPHLVAYVDDLELFDKELCAKMRYKYNANVNFAKADGDRLYVRTYERGVEDETLACGTGMAASFYGAYRDKKVKDSVRVYPKSGEELEISFKNSSIYFGGEVRNPFNTIIRLDNEFDPS